VLALSPARRAVMKRHKFIAALVLMLCFGLVDSQVYKWVDEDGNVHFTDRPPENQQSTEVEIQESLPGTQEGESDLSAETWLEQQRAERDADRQQRQEQARLVEDDSQQRCQAARGMLRLLEIQCPAFYDERGFIRVECPHQPRVVYEGERRYIEDADRAASIKYFKEELKYCD